MRAGHSDGPECVHTLSCLQQPIREMKSWLCSDVCVANEHEAEQSRGVERERAACAVMPSGDKWHCSTSQMLAYHMPSACCSKLVDSILQLDETIKAEQPQENQQQKAHQCTAVSRSNAPLRSAI